jgi:hypothetical protein
MCATNLVSERKKMNKESPAADAPAPQDGAEQAATDILSIFE